MSEKIILYLPPTWQRKTDKQKEAQAEEDAFNHMVEDAIALDWERHTKEEVRASVLRLKRLFITDK